MKKNVLKFLLVMVLVAVTCLGLLACSKNNWNADTVTLKDPGNINSYGSFVVETDNYYYCINGIAGNSADNTFGTPVKGSLIAVKKDFSDSCVVVPKLFVAQDYNSGIFIYDGYVYYATPSVEKSISGSVQNTQLTFFRTKLDSTGTEEFFTLDSLTTEYRIVKGADKKVYIVYCSSSGVLYSYNTSTKETITIADPTATNVEREALSTYKFVNATEFSGLGQDVAVIYSTTVYTDIKGESTSRSTADYTNVYAYVPGANDEALGNLDCKGKLVLDGSKSIPNLKYTPSLVKDGYFFFCIQSSFGTEIGDYVISVDDLYNKVDNAKKVFNASLIADTTIFDLDAENPLENAYYVDSSSNYIVCGSLFTTVTEKTVAKTSSVSTLLFVDTYKAEDEDGNTAEFKYVYFFDSSNQLVRIYAGEKASTSKDTTYTKEQLVSQGVVSTSWYAPKLFKGDEKHLLFYADTSSSYGADYVKCIEVSKSYDEVYKNYTEDKEEIEENVSDLYIDGQLFVSRKLISTSEKVSMANAQISTYLADALTDSKILLDGYSKEFPEVGDKYDINVNLEKAKKVVEDLKKELPDESISESNANTIAEYNKIVKLSVLFQELDGIDNYDTNDEEATNNQKTLYQSKYNDAVKYVTELINTKSTTIEGKTYVDDLTTKMDQGLYYNFRYADDVLYQRVEG